MENPENNGSDLGKKVFFLYPPSVVKDELITRLLAQEYEVYLIKDVETVKTLLSRYPNSIVYVNIDLGLSESEWEEWIRAMRNDPVYKETGIGILSYNVDEQLQKKYLIDIGIQYGFIKLKLGLEESTKILLATLKASEAKGRRKYVRASCEHDTVSSINIREGPITASGKICDISVVGFSCIFDEDPGLKRNTLLHDIQLKLKASLIKTEAIVIGARFNEDAQNIYVMLFTNKMDGVGRAKIRNYIQNSLQANIEREALSVESPPKD